MHDVFGPYCVLLHVKREKLVQDGYTTRTLLINLAATRVAAGLRLGFSHRSSRADQCTIFDATRATHLISAQLRLARGRTRSRVHLGRNSDARADVGDQAACRCAEHSWFAWKGSDDTVRGTRLRRRGSASGAMEYCLLPERVSDSRSITREVDLRLSSARPGTWWW